MSDIKLTPTGNDIDITDGKLSLVDGLEYTRQKLLIRLRFFLGEWFLDERLGFPYFERVLGKKNPRTSLDALFRQVILSTPDVIEILTFTADLDTNSREYSLAFKVRATDGVIIVRDLPFLVA